MNLPADLSAPGGVMLRVTRWCVTWICDDAGHWREAYFADRALADAYAASRRGSVIVRLMTLDQWPSGDNGR